MKYNQNSTFDTLSKIVNVFLSKQFGVIRVDKPFFFDEDNTSKSKFVMLDEAGGIYPYFQYGIPRKGYNIQNESIKTDNISNTWHVFSKEKKFNDLTEGSSWISTYLKKPILIVTSIHVGAKSKDALFDELSALETDSFKDFKCWFFECLDTAEFIIVFNSNTVKSVLRQLFFLSKNYPGSIINSNVACLKSAEKDWSEVITRCHFCIALKDTSVIPDLDKIINSKKSNNGDTTANVRITPELLFGSFGSHDIMYEFQNIRGADIVECANKVNKLTGIYDVAIQLGIQVPTDEHATYKKRCTETGEEDVYRILCDLKESDEKITVIQDNIKANAEMFGVSVAENINDQLSVLHAIIKQITYTYKNCVTPSPALPMIVECIKTCVFLLSDNLKEAHTITLGKDIIQQVQIKSQVLNNIEQNPDEAQRSLSRFMNELNQLFLQTSAGTMQFQVSAFKTTLRQMPERLISYYYAYIDSLSLLLRKMDNDAEENRFAYLVVPGAFPAVQVERLFFSLEAKYRLMLVGFPNSFIFNPEILLPSLTHEIAHYAGNTPRKREERKDMLFDCLIYYILYSTDEPISSSEFRLLRSEADSISSIELSKQGDDHKNKMNHSLKIQDQMQLIAHSLQQDEIVRKWAEIRMGMRSAVYDKERALQNEISSIEVLFWNLNFRSIDIFIKTICELATEIHADIIAIMALHLSRIEYFEMLLCNGASDFNCTLIQERVHVVEKVMNKSAYWNKSRPIQEQIKHLFEQYDAWDKVINSRDIDQEAFPFLIRTRMVKYFDMVFDFVADNWKEFDDLAEQYSTLRNDRLG